MDRTDTALVVTAIICIVRNEVDMNTAHSLSLVRDINDDKKPLCSFMKRLEIPHEMKILRRQS